MHSLMAFEEALELVEDLLLGVEDPEALPVGEAIGRLCGRDVVSSRPFPVEAVAGIDGYALQALSTQGAGLYAPVSLTLGEQAHPVNAGDAMPVGCDAVAGIDQVGSPDERAITVTEAVASGIGVVPGAGDVDAGAVVLRRGDRITPLDAARLEALGIGTLHCEPLPRVALLAGAVRAGEDITGALLERLCRGLGCEVFRTAAEHLAEGIVRLEDERVDLLLIYGGSGWGANDYVAHIVEDMGSCHVHGIAMNPGESTVLGQIGPVTLVVGLPGAPWPAAAALDLLLTPVLARRTGVAGRRAPGEARLARKITSSVGLEELVPVRVEHGEVHPLPRSAWLPPVGMNGVVRIAAGSEGYAGGERVTVVPLPAGVAG